MYLDYHRALTDAGYVDQGGDVWVKQRRFDHWTIRLEFERDRLRRWEANQLSWWANGIGGHSLCQFLRGLQDGEGQDRLRTSDCVE